MDDPTDYDAALAAAARDLLIQLGRVEMTIRRTSRQAIAQIDESRVGLIALRDAAEAGVR